MSPFYEFSAKALNGKEIKMSEYAGKLVVVVNTASKCGFTPQFEGLEAIYKKYKNQGLVILGFPCNQFANQEPDDEASIARGCVLNYGVTFQMFSKINVNGSEAHPLYKYLKSSLNKMCCGRRIKWNFTKFIIDRDGTPIKRFGPTVTPNEIEKFLLENSLLKQN